MKKILFLMAIVAIVAITFTNCKKDKNKGPQPLTIKAQVENGANYNDVFKRVRAIIYDYPSPYILDHTNWVNGGFTLTLPATIDTNYFYAIGDEDFPPSITISNKNARVTEVDYFEGFSSTTGWDYWYNEDDFIHAKIDVNLTSMSISVTQVYYLYADSPLSISGSYTDYDREVRFSLSLRAGWNVGYQTMKISMDGIVMEVSTNAVAGCKWYTLSDLYDLIPFKASENNHGDLMKNKLKTKRTIFGKPIKKSK
ncbi:MAG: hypothetical protein LBH22_05925 [Bacteroidales bacterium]|nr:hypothetical protein [Bacteroidales bacterium]